ncbi:lysozyme family protein [Bacillus haynesii]|uniref:lysozyme family protein n=1 Tax=Bacillus haynesii TaxID=1925021 RepID=UPI002281091A|nr:lysozyme family protein [Bacillus haynesii]MCY8577127.1 lysozyme family protein [Bacillus haynesii]
MAIVDRYTPYGGLIEHHLRIGDTEFYVPPTAISVHRQMKNKRTQILRARNSLPKESGYFDRVIELTLFFPDMDSINMELRPLMAQVKKCPFLPIENTFLNEIKKIEAVTIAGITVQTTPGFPHTLQAQIQCYAFEPYSYISDDEDRSFDEMFNWPLFRWYYMRNLDPQTGSGFNTFFEPLYHDLDHSFKFRIASEDDLSAMAQWKAEKKQLIKDYIKEKKENFWGNEEREKEFFKKYDEQYAKAMFEYDIHYDDWDIPGLVLTDFSVGFENMITSQQIQGDQSPTHQYMGSQDTMIVARFQTNDMEAIASLEALITRSTYLIRNYHKEVANGFLELDHQLARLFGVRNVTIEDMQTNTVQGQPGTYDVTLSMIAYNRAERKLNEVQWLSETVEWDIDKYEDQGFWSLLTAANPFNWIPDTTSEDYEPSDWYKQFTPLYRWGRFVADRPVFKEILSGVKTFLNGHKMTATDLSEKGIKKVIYDEAIKQVFRAAEVYPDLELPTYGEVTAAGFDIENSNNGVFVDPDFFIKYKTGLLFWENLVDSIDQNYKTVLRDSSGGQAVMEGGEITETNETTTNELKESKKDFKNAHEDSQADYSEISKDLIDNGNITPSEMEALIREKAKENGINQNLPLAFAKVMDEELKQFYEKGTNAKQGKVVNSNSSSPVMLNNNFNFYTNKDGSIDGEYIGVMKVRKMYGSNVNLLGKNIEYNVESGTKKMASLYTELDRIYTMGNSGNSNIYNEKNVFNLYGLNEHNSWDAEKARFAGVIMMYLGFDKEYTALIKDNKRPPSKIINLVKSVLKKAANNKEWSTQQIQNKVKGLPVKDFKTSGAKTNTSESTMDTTKWDDNNAIHKGMMHDMLRYDMRGRLVRAFPTFFLAFIDEGQYVGTVKLSDQFFNYKAVMDIMYTNSRKEASSTLVLEMSNVFGTLDDAEKGMDLTNTSYSEVFKTLTMPGAVAREAERSRHRNPNYYKSIMLRTGTRIHFRMGYGSNPMNMPTIMNGTITSITNNVESLTVVAQDDGLELTNKIRADVNETTKGGFLFSKKEPTEIVDDLLTDDQGFFKNLWAGLSNEEYENHSLGLMHFGEQGLPDGWSELKSFFGGVTGGASAGAVGGAVVGGPIGAAVGAIGGALGGGLFGSLTFGKDAREIREINVNVYQTTGLTNDEHDQWWNKVQDAFGIGKADEPGINIGLYDKSVWDVLNICASIGDDHIVAVHPFGFRNTIFSGKTYFPLHYDYIVENEEVVGTAVKPFRQFHVYDSVTSILDNNIETTEENMRTVGVGVYMNEGEQDTTSPVYVDTNIWPEKQRVVNIDTTMNAQGVRLIENIPLVGGLLNKPMKWYFDEGVAIKITARGLSDYVRDMYDGYLTVMGDPSVKPYDQMLINDTYNAITGPADVKEVVQIMNHQMGFITMIKPDAVVVNSDRRSMGFMMACQNIAGSALITFALRKLLRTSKYAGNLPILNALWAVTRNSFDRMKQRFKTSRVTGKLYDKLTGKSPSNSKAINNINKARMSGSVKASDISRAIKNGTLDQLTKLTGNSKGDLAAILKGTKQLGYNSITKVKLGVKASGFIASGTKNLRTALKGVGGMARLLWGGAHAAAGPVGWLAFAIETLAVHIISSTIGEFIERWLFMRQACVVAPLTKDGMEFTAGLNGHKGSVVGDSPDFWNNLMTNDFSALLLGFIGVDAQQYSQEAKEGEISLQATSPSNGLTLDVNRMAKDIFNRFRSQTRTDPEIKSLYDKDRKAALQQINKRLELLESREGKAKYEQEKTSWEDWIKKIGNKIQGWFSSLWDKVTSFFGGSDDGSVCESTGDVTTSGKAKGLSKYFDVVGPKIEKECKRQGLSQYAEIIKAKCMQESGGNYKKYPDVMQASESMGKPIGYIKDVDASIKQGVKYFGQIVKRTKGDIKMALQSYNFGTGFIDYCMKHGGKYTKQLAHDFAAYMVKKLDRKISRVEPGYGDSNYVDHVLRYYSGTLPSGECANSNVSGGASSCPSVTGAAGKKKYHTTSGKELIDLKSIKNKPFGIIIVGGGGTSKVRKGTAEALTAALKAYGKKPNITSGWRPGDSNWHGTGWAVDIDTPNNMRTINGKMRFPKGKDKNNARKLAECCIKAGFRALYFGDWDIVQEMNKKYGSGTMHYDPAGHYNHLHCSYPICKKK